MDTSEEFRKWLFKKPFPVPISESSIAKTAWLACWDLQQKRIGELEEQIEVQLKLLQLLYCSDRKVQGGSPLYSLNPSWRTMQCVEAALNKVDPKTIKEKLTTIKGIKHEGL